MSRWGTGAAWGFGSRASGRASYFGNEVAPTHPVIAVHQDDVKDLADAGYRIDGPMPHGDGSLHLYVSDPDNHAIEFWGWRPGAELD